MTAHDVNLGRPGLLRWLGFGPPRERSDATGEEDPSPPAEHDVDPGERHRRHLLDDIGRFLITHRLEVSPFTLEIAHDVVSGANPMLGRLVAQRVAERVPITQDWLEDTCRSNGMGNGTDQLSELVDRLEASVARFVDSAGAARSATSDYSSALAAHVDGLDAQTLPEAGPVIAELATLAREMLSRTRLVERELTRAERETRDLQQNLADARRQAEIDHLTGLPNRRAFETVLTDETGASRECGDPLCVAFCDIDHFKRINDTHGHEAGDRILRTVATALASISDDRCHVARHGGEEFVVLLRGRPLELACEVLDDARAVMASRRLVNRATQMPFGQISFSAGVADVHAYPSPRDALRAADAALYEAKRSGRNRVCRAANPAATGSDPGPLPET